MFVADLIHYLICVVEGISKYVSICFFSCVWEQNVLVAMIKKLKFFYILMYREMITYIL